MVLLLCVQQLLWCPKCDRKWMDLSGLRVVITGLGQWKSGARACCRDQTLLCFCILYCKLSKHVVLEHPVKCGFYSIFCRLNKHFTDCPWSSSDDVCTHTVLCTRSTKLHCTVAHRPRHLCGEKIAWDHHLCYRYDVQCLAFPCWCNNPPLLLLHPSNKR